MSEELIDKLQLDSSFYGDGFKFIIKKVYKYNNKVNGVQARYTWSNEYGNFCSTPMYISRKELFSDDYDDEFVQI